MNAILKFAKEQGYNDIIYLNKWNGYDVYEPVFSLGEVAFVGPPLVILVKDKTIRMSTVEEAYQHLEETDAGED